MRDHSVDNMVAMAVAWLISYEVITTGDLSVDSRVFLLSNFIIATMINILIEKKEVLIFQKCFISDLEQSEK